MTAHPKSVSEDQFEILDAIQLLHCPNGFDVDATFGNGGFYRSKNDWPTHRFDADNSLQNCVEARSDDLPLPDGSVASVVFDPPFLTYIRDGRCGNGSMALARRFGGYWRYDELADPYKSSLQEFSRVLSAGGILVFKCQDIVHNHRLHATHANVMQWASEVGFRLKDLFILTARHRMPAPNRRGQPRHARVFHSYFLVFTRLASAHIFKGAAE